MPRSLAKVGNLRYLSLSCRTSAYVTWGELMLSAEATGNGIQVTLSYIYCLLTDLLGSSLRAGLTLLAEGDSSSVKAMLLRDPFD